MDPHLPFLKAIAADPPDDLPRLVYADFLEETGEPVHVARAHFIRTQIALETLRPRTREYREAKALGERLMDMFVDVWLLGLPEYLHKQDRVIWRRGFPEGIRIGLGYPDDWGLVRPDWFDLHPIREVHIERIWGPGAYGWATRFRWSAITRLQLGPGVSPLDHHGDEMPVFDDLLTFPGFTALRLLDLSENRLTDAWLVGFASRYTTASFAPTLAELDLSRCFEITDAGANTLATAPGLDRLTVLNIKDIPLTAPAVAMLRRRFGPALVV